MSENSRIELALATTLAYLAGIIVGDGYVSIARAVRKGVIAETNPLCRRTPSMDTIRKMKGFVAGADTGRFTKAAHQLSVGLAVISSSVTELEGHLRTRLLNR
jgi:hypothetical protein